MGNKGIALLLGLAALIGGIVFYLSPKGSSESLKFCTWSNYYPESILEDFTKKTGIRVELSYVSSNEELFAKLKAGATGYDLIQPSDYMVRQMTKLSMLKPLEHSQLPNLSHLDEYYLNLSYDRGLKYSVPFNWGTTGIAINTEKVTVPGEGVSWKMLFESPDPKHTSLLDDMREVFAAVMLWKGNSINSTSLPVLEAARNDIARIKDNILMFSSEPKPLLLKGEITIAHIYSCDGIQAQIDNPKIRYFIPKEGGVVWTDNFAIPVSSRKEKEAHAFINYFLEPENALKIATQNHLAIPNRTARARLPAEQLNNPNFYPSAEVLVRMKFLEDLGDTLLTINRMWTELKT